MPAAIAFPVMAFAFLMFSNFHATGVTLSGALLPSKLLCSSSCLPFRGKENANGKFNSGHSIPQAPFHSLHSICRRSFFMSRPGPLARIWPRHQIDA